MVGAGTALRDDPALTVRLPGYRGSPKLRILVDGAGATPETGRLFTDGQAPTLVATSERAPQSRRRAWAAAGAEVLVVGDPGQEHVRLDRLFEELGKRDVQHVLLEGGPTLAWESVRQGIVDKVVLFLAPKLLGGAGAPGVLMGGGSPTVDEALPLDVADVEPVGPDIKVTAYVHRDR
jgi:diaminohydroxyphosphoribosylaminopyrimidine deaminase/5-amino-6-(5-phosphoribosylamino)uracil reductase